MPMKFTNTCKHYFKVQTTYTAVLSTAHKANTLGVTVAVAKQVPTITLRYVIYSTDYNDPMFLKVFYADPIVR